MGPYRGRMILAKREPSTLPVGGAWAWRYKTTHSHWGPAGHAPPYGGANQPSGSATSGVDVNSSGVLLGDLAYGGRGIRGHTFQVTDCDRRPSGYVEYSFPLRFCPPGLRTHPGYRAGNAAP